MGPKINKILFTLFFALNHIGEVLFWHIKRDERRVFKLQIPNPMIKSWNKSYFVDRLCNAIIFTGAYFHFLFIFQQQ